MSCDKQTCSTSPVLLWNTQKILSLLSGLYVCEYVDIIFNGLFTQVQFSTEDGWEIVWSTFLSLSSCVIRLLCKLCQGLLHIFFLSHALYFVSLCKALPIKIHWTYFKVFHNLDNHSIAYKRKREELLIGWSAVHHHLQRYFHWLTEDTAVAMPCAIIKCDNTCVIVGIDTKSMTYHC